MRTEGFRPSRSFVASTMTTCGDILEKLGRNQEAMAVLEEARSRMQHATEDDQKRMARTIRQLKQKTRTP